MRIATLAASALMALVAPPATAFAAPPVVGGCEVFPDGDSFNADISSWPVNPNSASYIAEVNRSGGTLLHPDFGSNPAYGIPFIVTPFDQPLKPVIFTAYGDQSDPGPYPIPKTAPVEGGSDRHVLAVHQGECRLYELYAARWSRDRKAWKAASGAVFDLGEPLQGQRPDGWTSADAAGLPILPGLVRYREVAAGSIDHAIRVTFQRSARKYLDPATHCAAPADAPTWAMPMGMRLRLNMSDTTLNGFTGQARVILTAMRRYGLIMADNGSNWFFSGQTDPRWDDEDLDQLKSVPGSAFQVVDPPGAVLHSC